MKDFSIILLLSLCLVAFASQAQKHPFQDKFHHEHISKAKAGSSRQAKVAVYPDSIEGFLFDPIKQAYDPDCYQISYPKYDANGNQTELITRYFGTPGGESKKSYLFLNGVMVETVYFDWNKTTQKWDSTAKFHLHKNQFGVDSSRDDYQYNQQTGFWDLDSRSGNLITYDASYRPVTNIYREFNISNQTWELFGRIRFVYLGVSKLPFEIYVDEEDGQGGWSEVYFIENLEWKLGFDGNLDDYEPTHMLGKEWNGSAWDYSFYDSTIVDQNNVLEDYFYEFKNGNFTLVHSEKHVFDGQASKIYTEVIEWDGSLADTSFIEIDSFQYGPGLEILEHINVTYTFLGSKTEFHTKEKYYYGITGLEPATQSFMNVYPNPVSSYGIVKLDHNQVWKEVELISMDGRSLKRWKLNLDQGLELNGVKSGIYLIRAIDEVGKVFSGKLQVQ